MVPSRNRREAARAGVLIAVATLALAGALAAAETAPGAARARPAGKGTVTALFAGSLVDYMENDFGPAFQRASGYGYQGFGGGSSEVASEIRGGVRRGDVFISAAASVDGSLEGHANGDWVSWYATFAASPLQLGYDPSSRLGKELARGKPWYDALTQPGILVGRTDPKLDPKGILTVEAVDNAARRLHEPKLASALNGFPVYPETALVGRLQSGQLEAGFFYQVEAASAHFPTVELKPISKYALYTLTILNRDPDAAGAAALVRYLLSSERSDTLRRNGLAPLRPKFSGAPAAVPGSLRGVLGAS